MTVERDVADVLKGLAELTERVKELQGRRLKQEQRDKIRGADEILRSELGPTIEPVRREPLVREQVESALSGLAVVSEAVVTLQSRKLEPDQRDSLRRAAKELRSQLRLATDPGTLPPAIFGGMIKTCGSGRACLPANMIPVVT